MDRFKAIATAPHGVRLCVVSQLGGGATVNREGGQSAAGMIAGLSLITGGEAQGHGAWIDDVFLDQVTASAGPVKARFTHPGLSSDGLGTLLGRLMNFKRDGDMVRGDLHFVKSAHFTPDGDLADYVMQLAEESPDMAGLSIVFERDFEEEDRFRAEHSDEEGNFKSPAAANEKNLHHFRLASLVAVDMVDEPAANPDGMFSTDGGFLAACEELVGYGLGITDVPPASESLTRFGVHPARLRSFVRGYIERAGLRIVATEVLANTEQHDRDTECRARACARQRQAESM